jgi:hypothetical protein
VRQAVQAEAATRDAESQARAAAQARVDGLAAAVATLDQLIASPRPAGLSRAEAATWDEQTAWLRSVSDRYRPLGTAYGGANLAAPFIPGGAVVSAAITGPAPAPPARPGASAAAPSLAELDAQFLALQQAVQNESRRFQTLSNASKARHDVAMNAIRNLK